MRVFVTGGSGLTGPSVVTELINAGHAVTGLARSEESAARLRGLGASTHPGSLDDLDSLRAGAAAAEGVVHMAFGGDFADPDGLVRRDTAAIDALGQGLLDSGGADRPLLMTSGTFVMRAGSVSSEQDRADDEAVARFRIPGERACLAFTERGLRSGAVRLAPTVHGPADYGFIPMMIAAARRTGVAGYVGHGVRWPAVHRLDAATLFRLALEKGPAGSAYHGAAENVHLQEVAEVIGETLDLPVRSLTPEQAAEHFGNPFMAIAYGTDAPASSAWTRETLGWEPTHPTLLDELRNGDYFAEPDRSLQYA
ncbi:SDR family oxidoreductase [uncultured Jatrophihabitans sp.]|uniref:SDR family oxidoreductase n=1 Tax=uncultured Jatrophihabitans sp. TaxID=1610747 RepID=UPI0035CAFF86